jgi:YHS domain-containing protein
MKDPICGMDVDPKAAAGSSTYQGQTYYFCSKGCKAAFDADPAKYVGHAGHGGHTGHGHGSH